MKQDSETSGLQTLAIIWSGQVISLIGSGLVGFAIGVWVYQQTGSATQYALLTFCASVPAVVLSPFAGVLVDRWDRRTSMIVGDAVAGLTSVVLLFLVWYDVLEVWHLYCITATNGAFSALQQPAFAASIPLLVPKRLFGRIAGLTQAGAAGPQMITPFLAGMLLAVIGLRGLIAIDLVTMSFAIATLLVVRIPRPPFTEAGREGGGSFFREALFGWTYIRQRPGLLALLILFAGFNFAMGIMQVLIAPLVLSFGSPAAFGTVLSLAALGFFTGSILMTAWGGPKKRIRGILVLLTLQAMILFVGGVKPNVTLIATAAFVYMFLAPVTIGCSTVIWQSKVAPDVMGRVFAIRRLVALSALPLAYLVAGPLADHVFEPWLAEGGALASTVGAVIGVGPGRGIGFLYIFLAIITLVAIAIGYGNHYLRNLETDLPDVIDQVMGEESGVRDQAGDEESRPAGGPEV